MYVYIYIYIYMYVHMYKLAHQKSTPQKSSWIFSGIFLWSAQWHFPT